MLLAISAIAVAEEPWVITTHEVITGPTELGDVIVWEGGSLTVSGVGEPGVQFQGNLWVGADAALVLTNSVIEFRRRAAPRRPRF